MSWESGAVAAGMMLLLGGCVGGGLSVRDQQCMECAVRAHTDPAAARAARPLLTRQCGAGDSRSCSVLGSLYEHGQGVATQPRRAERLYRAACLDGNTTGCVNLGRMLIAGSSGRVDRKGAEVVLEVACQGRHPEGCYALGRLRYQAGDGTGAAAALRKGCDETSADACFGLAAMLQHGHGVKADPAEARALYTRACAAGHAEGCRRAVTTQSHARG